MTFGKRNVIYHVPILKKWTRFVQTFRSVFVCPPGPVGSVSQITRDLRLEFFKLSSFSTSKLISHQGNFDIFFWLEEDDAFSSNF